MPFVWAIAMLVVSYVISAAIQPKPTKPKASGLSDFDFPQMDEGTPQAVVFGDCWTEDWMVLWYGNLRNKAVKSGGGKK